MLSPVHIPWKNYTQSTDCNRFCTKRNKDEMATSFNNEIDPVVKKAVRLLHSSHPNSATDLRLLLNEIIQRIGPEKTLTKTLSKRLLDEETKFPGLIPTPPPAPQQPPTQAEHVDEVINLTHSPDTDAMSGTVAEDETNLKDFGDLNCFVCGEMMITATNRLIECSKCSTLYHQECHKPPITDEEASEGQECNWQCDSCTSKPTTSKATGIVVLPDEPVLLVSKSKTSVGSSRSSSPFFKQDSNVAIVATPSTSQASGSSSSSSSKHHHHHHHKSSSSSKSSSKSSKHQDGSSKRKSHK